MSDTVHVYLFDGYADWEPAFAMAGIRDPQFQREPGRWKLLTVGDRAGVPVRSMGGLTVAPDIGLNELHARDSALLILPGGTSWIDEPQRHGAAIEAASQFLDVGVPVAAICGATAGLARAGWLDDRAHTSNAAAYLKGTGYEGGEHYRDAPAVRVPGLITAGGMAPLEFAREIFIELGVYDDEVVEAWYQLFKTGKSEYFARMARAAEQPAGAARQLPEPVGGRTDGRAAKEIQMRNSNRPSGPGKPVQERRDNASEREELEDMSGAQASESSRGARQAERDAHVNDRGKRAGGAASRDRNR
jgi:putative intracellular protease/amidase